MEWPVVSWSGLEWPGVGCSGLECIEVAWSGLEWPGVAWSVLERNSIKPVLEVIANYRGSHREIL